MIVASNSGSNAVTSEIVSGIQERGAKVVAITSLNHATSSEARDSGRPRLHELADVVIDNGGAVGDAAVDIEGFDQRVVRFCFAKKDETLRMALERLAKI